jgi:hypothetical protein
MQYAPLQHPGLSEDIVKALDSLLGSAVSKPFVDQLRSPTSSDQTFASQPQRQTPRYLRVIASPEDERRQRLKAECKGDVGVLRWECMQQYLGSTADVVV